MPRLTQLAIRTALVWLAIGFSLAALMLANKGVPLLPALWVLRTSHVHVLMVGWIVQLAWGVAFWILPRLDALGSRGDERLMWCCYAMLNSGVVIGALHDPLAATIVWAGWRLFPPIMGLLYCCAALLFVINAWPRIVAFRTLPRPTPAP